MLFLQQIACDIDFNDSEAYAGTSYWPFIGFMCFFIGLVVAFIGIVKISNSGIGHCYLIWCIYCFI